MAPKVPQRQCPVIESVLKLTNLPRHWHKALCHCPNHKFVTEKHRPLDALAKCRSKLQLLCQFIKQHEARK